MIQCTGIPSNDLDRAVIPGFYQLDGSQFGFPDVPFFGILEVICVPSDKMGYRLQILTNIVTGARYMRRAFGDHGWLSWEMIGVPGGARRQHGCVEVDDIVAKGKKQPIAIVKYHDERMFDDQSQIVVVASMTDQMPLYQVDYSTMQITKNGFTFVVQNREDFDLPIPLRWNWIAIQ